MTLNISNDSISTSKGRVAFSKNGFEFITIASYYQDPNILQELIDALFNSKYRTIEAISSINTLEEAEEAIPKHNNGEYKSRLDAYTDRFIRDKSATTVNVMEVSSGENIGSTLGEKSATYYKFITQSDEPKRIYFIDQPEDNLSTPKILDSLFSSLGRLRDSAQVIFVTHNPLLVVNFDVDNVLFLNNKNGRIEITQGCLESGNILDLIATNMDGGTNALKRRLKVYE